MVRLTQILAALLVVLALLLGGYAWWLGGRSGASAQAVSQAGPTPAPVAAVTFPAVVTRRAVAAGNVLQADALQVVRLPIDPPGVLRDVAAATGRVPVADLAAGALLTESGLASGLALRLAEGERAVAVRADETMGVANRVRPGDFVDVFFLLRTDGREVERSQARLLLARQRVLAFGSASVDGSPATDGSGNASTTSRPLEAARTVVLAVQVQDVPRLALGEANGRLLLALRHPGDAAVPDAGLFAALPTALRPAAGPPGRGGEIRPIDQAHAGLAVADLAGGGTSATPFAPRTTATPPSGSGSISARARPSGGALARNPIEIESIRGEQREIVSY